MKNYLQLSKCAYIFDSTYNNYFYGTKEQYRKKCAIQSELKKFYDDEAKRNEKIPYMINEAGKIQIVLCNEPHILNDLQIACISDVENVINHRRNINVDNIIEKVPHFHKFCNDSIYSKKFKTLSFEFFTGSGELGYIRVCFNGTHEQFIIDDRTGELFTSGEYGRHEPTTAATIAARLGIKSAAARAEFYEVINNITNTEV